MFMSVQVCNSGVYAWFPKIEHAKIPYTQSDFEAEYACSGLQFGQFMHDSPRWKMPKTLHTAEI